MWKASNEIMRAVMPNTKVNRALVRFSFANEMMDAIEITIPGRIWPAIARRSARVLGSLGFGPTSYAILRKHTNNESLRHETSDRTRAEVSIKHTFGLSC